MDVSALKAEGELVRYSFADQGRAGGKRLLDDRRGACRRLLLREPVRIAAAGAAALHIDQILDRKGQAVERPRSRGLAPAHSVGNERAEISRHYLRCRDRAHVSGPRPPKAI